MLTNCKNDLPNPHKNCLRAILDELIIRHNDFRRMNVEMKNLRAEFKMEMQRLQFPCGELRKVLCCQNYDKTKGESFIKRMGELNEVYNCFTQRIDCLNGKIEEVIKNSRNCLTSLGVAKRKFKRFHEETVEHLKRHSIMSRDPAVVRNCEMDICELQRLFVKEVAYVRQVEAQLQIFFEQLQQGASQEYIQGDVLKKYEWIPAAKNFDSVNDNAKEIISRMGGSLVKALAQQHIQQPEDVKGFLASYLLNLERNEQMLQEKMKLLNPNESEVITCEQTL